MKECLQVTVKFKTFPRFDFFVFAAEGFEVMENVGILKFAGGWNEL